MIKRRFYRQDRGDGDSASSDSSSSSDSELEAHSSPDSDTESQQAQPDPEPTSDVEPDNEDSDEEEEKKAASLRLQLPSSSSSGYVSEDSSADEIEVESPGLPNDEKFGGAAETLDKEQPIADDIPSCILRCKSVFKCRLCPKIVCLNMESLRAHLQSKRHSRSEKLLIDGRLKRILNSDGEEEVLSDEDGETHAERHARIVALAQSNIKKKGRGRQRQRERLKRKKQKSSSDILNSGQKKENRAKRRRKNE